MTPPTTLWHYTCQHAAERIDRAGGVLAPYPHPLLVWDDRRPFAAVWLTDLAEIGDAERYGLGLTSDTLECDRTAVRYRVPYRPNLLRWDEIRYRLRTISLQAHLDLEAGRMLQHWYVALGRTTATRDYEWQTP